jgi:hypothetical protein
VFQSEREIKEGIKQVICERITMNEFRELIANLSIIETSAFKKYLREVEYGGLFSYSKVLRALCSFDISYVHFHNSEILQITHLPSTQHIKIDKCTNFNFRDYTEIQSPQKVWGQSTSSIHIIIQLRIPINIPILFGNIKKVLPKTNPIPLISDIYLSHTPQKEPGTPTKALQSSNFFSEEFNTPQIHTPGKKFTPQKPSDPLPTITPSPFQKSAFVFIFNFYFFSALRNTYVDIY